MNATLDLIENLNHPDGTARRQAALALGAIEGEEAASALLTRLKHEKESCVREDLTWAIVQHSDDVEDQILGMLGSESADDRRTAAHVLSKVADPRHFEAVRAIVADTVADVAIKGYRAAANTGGERAVPDLAQRLGDGDLLQRDALANAFAHIGAPAVPALVEALSHDAVAVRLHAAEVLGHLGEGAADTAAGALAALAADPDSQVRIAAVSALGQLGVAADDHLKRLAAGDSLSARVAAQFLATRTA